MLYAKALTDSLSLSSVGAICRRPSRTLAGLNIERASLPGWVRGMGAALCRRTITAYAAGVRLLLGEYGKRASYNYCTLTCFVNVMERRSLCSLKYSRFKECSDASGVILFLLLSTVGEASISYYFGHFSQHVNRIKILSITHPRHTTLAENTESLVLGVASQRMNVHGKMRKTSYNIQLPFAY